MDEEKDTPKHHHHRKHELGLEKPIEIRKEETFSELPSDILCLGKLLMLRGVKWKDRMVLLGKDVRYYSYFLSIFHKNSLFCVFSIVVEALGGVPQVKNLLKSYSLTLFLFLFLL